MIELFRECKYQRANCQSSYSLWVFLHHSLFVCPLNAQQSHSKWIICLSKRIVLGQIMCCTGNGFAPAWNLSWISLLLLSFLQLAPVAPLLGSMNLSTFDWNLGLNRHQHERPLVDEWICHTSYTHPAADEVMKRLSTGMMSSVMCFYRLVSRDIYLPGDASLTPFLCGGSCYSCTCPMIVLIQYLMTLEMGLNIYFFGISKADARTWVQGVCLHVKSVDNEQMML